jgi:uncharacterized protein (DUF1778 family)
MAKPIKATPVLKGKSAKKFYESLDRPDPKRDEILERAVRVYEATPKHVRPRHV